MIIHTGCKHCQCEFELVNGITCTSVALTNVGQRVKSKVQVGLKSCNACLAYGFRNIK